MAPPILGEVPQALGRGSRLISGGSIAGPASYLAGGFTIAATLTGLSTIESIVVTPRNEAELQIDDFAYGISYSFTGGVITILLREAELGGTTPQSWAEVANATDLSALTFDYQVIGS